MKKRLTIIFVTLALAITGITISADKAKAETASAHTEAPTMTSAPMAEPVIGQKRGDTPDTYEVYTENGWEKVVWKIGDVWLKDADGMMKETPVLIYTPTGWKPYDEGVGEVNRFLYPEPTDAPMEVEWVEVEREGSFLSCPVKDVIEITKGFKSELRIDGDGITEVDWTSSNPDVISIIKTGNTDYGFSVVVEAKKYGKSTLTAKYAGYTTKIILKSAKNQYVCYSRPQYWDAVGETILTTNQFASVKYDKKGNIVVKFGQELTKWTKFGKKYLRQNPKKCHASNSIKMSIICNGKKVVKNYEKRVKKIKFCTLKKPKCTYTVIIPKKYIKKKNMDLRKCDYDVELFTKVYFRGRWL